MARYGLGEFDFYDDGEGFVVVNRQLPDDPPVFEPFDTPVAPLLTMDQRVDGVLGATALTATPAERRWLAEVLGKL